MSIRSKLQQQARCLLYNLCGFAGRAAQWLLALAALAVLSAGLVSRAAALPAVDIAAGFDGYYRPGEWTPVVVTLNNQPLKGKTGDNPPPFRGILAIPVESESDPPAKFTCVREVEVPAFSIQRFYLYARFPGGTISPNLELRATNGKLLQIFPLPVKPLPLDGELILTAAEDLTPLSLPLLPGVELLTRANSAPDRLPESWWGYQGAGCVILTRWSDTYLRPAQEEALRQWIECGGKVFLLMGAEPDSWKGGFMDDLRPALPNGGERIRFKDGVFQKITGAGAPVLPEDLIVARLTPKPEAETLCQLEGTPLIVRQRRGLGQVIAVALDIQAKSERLPAAFSAVFRELLPYRVLTSSRVTWENDLRSNLPVISRRAARPPNIFIIFLLLAAYAVIVGPLNFRFLSKRRRLELAWITVPIIVIIFSVVIYGLGVLTKGGRLIVREAALVTAGAGQSTASLRGVVGLFSPEKERYWARPKKSALALGQSDLWDREAADYMRRSFSAFKPAQIGRQSAGLLGFSEARTILRGEGASQSISDLPMGQWDLAFLDAASVVDLEGALEANLLWKEEEITGTLRNATSRTLRSPVLLHGKWAMPLPKDLLPGDSFTLETGSAPFPRAGFQAPKWNSLETTLENRLISLQNFKSEDDRQRAEINQYLAHYFFNPRLTSKIFPPSGGETWLIAFGNEPEIQFNLSRKPDILTHSVCYMFRLSPRIAPGRWTLVGDEVSLELLARTGTGQAYFTDEEIFEMYNSDILFSASLPFEDPTVRIERVEIKFETPPNVKSDFRAEALNLATRRWENVFSSDWGANPEPYLGALRGRVLFRVSSQPPPASIGNIINRENCTLRSIRVSYVITKPG